MGDREDGNHVISVSDDECRKRIHSDGKEMNVRVHTHAESISNQDAIKAKTEAGGKRRCSFKQHFVEESTLKTIALDELEELSDAGGASGLDGNAVRASSSVIGEQVPVRFAVLLEWDKTLIGKPQGLLRMALLACSTISLACVVSAGTSDLDVLNLPFPGRIRFHIFTCVFTFLLSATFLFLDVSLIIQSLPLKWNMIDAVSSYLLGILFITSSSFLLHAEHVYQRHQPPIADWTRVQISLGAVFGFLSTLVCVFLGVLRCCGQSDSQAPEDIMLSAVRTS